MERSNLLAKVVAVTLLTATPIHAFADDIPTLDPVSVYGHWIPSGINPYSGGSGGSYGGGASTSNPSSSGAPTPCDTLMSNFDDGVCNILSPPPIVQNGCGDAENEWIPDHFVMSPSTGNIFTPSCNLHDACYAAYPANKLSCDNSLRNTMKATCDLYFIGVLKDSCYNQADIYADALAGTITFYDGIDTFDIVNTAVSQVAYGAFAGAQQEAICRNAVSLYWDMQHAGYCDGY